MTPRVYTVVSFLGGLLMGLAYAVGLSGAVALGFIPLLLGAYLMIVASNAAEKDTKDD